MKLEIDIDEDYYKIICKRVEENKPYHSPYEQEVIADGKPLEQEPRKGHWIERIERDEYNDFEEEWFECDQCHIDAERPCNYCPNCGCRMEK